MSKNKITPIMEMYKVYGIKGKKEENFTGDIILRLLPNLGKITFCVNMISCVYSEAYKPPKGINKIMVKKTHTALAYHQGHIYHETTLYTKDAIAKILINLKEHLKKTELKIIKKILKG